MKYVRKIGLTLAAVALLTSTVLTGAACHAPVTITTQAGKTAYTADQVVVRVNELENAAIEANSKGGLPVATTRVLVEFSVSADKVLKTTPKGWQTTVAASWKEAKGKIPQQTNPAVQAAMSAVDVVLAAYSGGAK